MAAPAVATSRAAGRLELTRGAAEFKEALAAGRDYEVAVLVVWTRGAPDADPATAALWSCIAEAQTRVSGAPARPPLPAAQAPSPTSWAAQAPAEVGADGPTLRRSPQA